MRENRAARFGKQANHEKRGKTSIRHRDQVKQQQKKTIKQTKKAVQRRGKDVTTVKLTMPMNA